MTFNGLTVLDPQVALVLASSALGSIYSFGQIKQLTPELVRVLFENAPEPGQYKHLSLDFPSVRSLTWIPFRLSKRQERRGARKRSHLAETPFFGNRYTTKVCKPLWPWYKEFLSKMRRYALVHEKRKC